MVIDLKFSRFENVPWGFRLIGGSDFDVPLTVIKVTEGGLAEKAGLKVGDVIVRINDDSTSCMTHNDAHDIIMRAGNNFFFGVIRSSEDHENQNNQEQIQDQHIQLQSQSPNSIKDCHDKSPVSDEIYQQLNEIPSVEPDQHNTDDEIAELMSGEGQVLDDHNVIGIFPKPGVCMSSEVLRTLNDESIKTEKQLEEEKRKWTTFLQKPNRPIPKSKKELEEEAKKIPYVVKIVKQPKPRVAPDRPPSPPPPPIIEPEPQPIQIPEEEPKKEEVLGPIPNDSEIPDLEQIVSKTEIENEIIEEIQENHQIEVSEIITEQNVQESHVIIESSQKIETKVEAIEKTAEEIALEKQLADVQKQLLSLSNLPSTIQATLDAVTKQLSELLPAFRLQPSPALEENKIEKDAEAACKDKETAEMMKICQERIMKLSENKILEIPYIPPPPTLEELENKRKEQEQLLLQDELAYKKQKEHNLISELEQKQRSIRDGTPRKSKRLFGPLTPQERPLVLPGGRKWRKPKDAYNDEFIAEILSSQAELIVGSTLGKTFESPNLGCDERHYNFIALNEQLHQRVNFLKYQKPEKKIDLEKSEVYKVIHHLDGGPKRGIEVRPPKVAAEEDIRPISCN